MELKRLLIWICFLFCLGLTVGGVLVFFRQQERKNLPAVRFLQYFLIMMYAYGFYAMWSDVFFRLLFPFEQQDELISKLSNFLFLIGTPFLLIGLIMLVLWTLCILQKKSLVLLIGGGFLAFLLVSLPFLITQRFEVLVHTDQLFALINMSVILFIIFQMSFSHVHYLEKHSKILLIVIILFLGIIQLPVIFNYLIYPAFELSYIFLFFLTNTALGVYFMYAGNFPPQEKESPKVISFDGFIEKYGISNREKEVIIEIYKGKTNQEIADCLFVTLQTIKDHTHRIYQKTEVKNRNQLATLLRKFENL